MPHPPPRLIPPFDREGAADDEERLQQALRAARPWAEREVLARFTGPIRRVLVRILGSAAEIDDLTQEVFVRGLDRIGELRPGVELRRWFASFAVNVAREALRARARRRWLLFFAPQELPDPLEPPSLHAMLDGDGADARRALCAIYRVLDTMSASARALFALRRLEGWELAELAATFGVSLATIKRRIADAEKTFFARAERDPVLASWLEDGGDR